MNCSCRPKSSSFASASFPLATSTRPSFRTFDELAKGESPVIINDHAPKDAISRSQREPQRESASAPFLALDRNPPAECLSDLLADRQTNAGAWGSRSIESGKLLKEAMLLIAAKALAGVHDLRRDPGAASRRAIVCLDAGAHGNASTRRSVFDGIRHQIREHLPDSLGVRQCRWQRRR
jgi:hypothetical protein